MSGWAKAGIVCAGYLLAIAAGGVASYAYNARMATMPYDTSGGMYAAGESMSALAAFLVVALVPTLLMLWFLRRNTRVWQAIAFISLGFAGVGLLAVLATMANRGSSSHPVLIVLELLGLAQLLGVPLWTGALVLFALLAPTPPVRRVLIAAIGVELVIGLCAVLHWFVLSSH